MKSFLINVLKLAVVALFVVAMDIILPFNSAAGLTYVKDHGKFWLVVIGIFNVFAGGAISAGFWSKDIRVGFQYWLMPTVVKKGLNPTHCFGAIALVFNLIVILWGIQP